MDLNKSKCGKGGGTVPWGLRTAGLKGQEAATSQHARGALAYHPQRMQALSAPAIQCEARFVPTHFCLPTSPTSFIPAAPPLFFIPFSL